MTSLKCWSSESLVTANASSVEAMREEHARCELQKARLELRVEEPILEHNLRTPVSDGLESRLPIAEPRLVSYSESLFRIRSKLVARRALFKKGANLPPARFECGNHVPQVQFGAAQDERRMVCNQQFHWARAPLAIWKSTRSRSHSYVPIVTREYVPTSLVAYAIISLAALTERL